MEQFILKNNGVASLDLEADYKSLQVREWTSNDIPKDYYILNNNKTMSVLKYIKKSEKIENLWCLSFVLDRKINGKLSTKIISYNLWCNKCRKDTRCYSFDSNIYKAIDVGIMNRCINCTDSQLRFSQHPKFKKDYEFNKYGNNYVHRNNDIYYIFSEDKYTILQLNNYDLKYHFPLKKQHDENHQYYHLEEINCTVCGERHIYEWIHNRTCINNINQFSIGVYSQINLLMRTLEDIPNDIKNIISNNLASTVIFRS